MQVIQTLILITKDNQVLLGLKKRGFGMGKLNGFGGKVEPGESIEEAAVREVFEEVSLEVKQLKSVATMEFSWTHKDDIFIVHLFHCTDYIGKPEESEEMKPYWYDLDKIPYKKMWDDDKYWFPLFLEGKKFNAKFVFDNKDKVIKHKIDLV